MCLFFIQSSRHCVWYLQGLNGLLHASSAALKGYIAGHILTRCIGSIRFRVKVCSANSKPGCGMSREKYTRGMWPEQAKVCAKRSSQSMG